MGTLRWSDLAIDVHDCCELSLHLGTFGEPIKVSAIFGKAMRPDVTVIGCVLLRHDSICHDSRVQDHMICATGLDSSRELDTLT